MTIQQQIESLKTEIAKVNHINPARAGMLSAKLDDLIYQMETSK